MMNLVGDHPRAAAEDGRRRVQGCQIRGNVGGGRHAAPFVLCDSPPPLGHARQQGGGVP